MDEKGLSKQVSGGSCDQVFPAPQIASLISPEKCLFGLILAPDPNSGMKRCDSVYCLAPLAAVVLVVTPVEAQSSFDHLPNPWGSSNDQFLDRHHHFFPDSRFFRFGYRSGWDPEQYGYPYYYVIPNDGFYRGVQLEYDERYPLDLAVMVQTELARLGFYDGPISGVIGSHSQMAIREFQEAQGLPVTGRIDQNLIRALSSEEFDPTTPKDSL